MGSRRPSEIALAALSEGHELCGQCLSRCATHDSLTRLDEEVAGILDAAPDEHQEAAEARDARTSVVGHSPFFVRETPSTAEALARSPHPSSPSAGALMVKTAAQCELCQEVATTWQSIIARILQVSLGAGLSYLLWLRFIASKETVKRHLFAITRILGRALFNYRVEGIENVPKSGPAILCNYHGFIPLDMYFFHEYIARVTGRTPTTLVADFVFKIPIFSYFVRCCGGVPASRRSALKALRAGGLVLVAPGGVREAMTTSAEDYVLRWYGKKGFAEMACATGAPVLPMFTSGIREVFLVLGGSLPIVQKLYRLTRLPFTPFIGPFPQALTSIVSAPKMPKGALPEDAHELAMRVMEALEELMRRSAPRRPARPGVVDGG